MITKIVRAWKRWRWARKEGKRAMWVRIAYVTPAQREALETLFNQWQVLGSIGSSRWTCFYADGDGNFRPRILVNGRKPRFSEHLSGDEVWERGEWSGELRIDFDTIARRMRDNV